MIVERFGYDADMATAGYSGTPLARKLGIAPGAAVSAIDETYSGLRFVKRKELRAVTR
jgi:hypothetical protein